MCVTQVDPRVASRVRNPESLHERLKLRVLLYLCRNADETVACCTLLHLRLQQLPAPAAQRVAIRMRYHLNEFEPKAPDASTLSIHDCRTGTGQAWAEVVLQVEVTMGVQRTRRDSIGSGSARTAPA